MAERTRIVPGRHIVAGSSAAVAVAVDIIDDGIAHVHPLSGSVASNAHLLEHRTESTDPASERLPDRLPDPVEVGGTERDETASPDSETPGTTRGKGTRRHQLGRGSSLITRRLARRHESPKVVMTQRAASTHGPDCEEPAVAL